VAAEVTAAGCASELRLANKRNTIPPRQASQNEFELAAESRAGLGTEIPSEADFPGTCTQRFIGVLSITSLRLEAVLNDHIKYYGSSFIMESSLVQKYFNCFKGIMQTYRAGSNFSLLAGLFKQSIFLESVS
jgi:hypothetical protein